MTRGIVTLTVGTLLLGALGGQSQGVKKSLTIKEVMKRSHAGPSCVLTETGRALKVESPDWASVQKLTRELIDLGTDLTKNAPPTGDKAAWDKLTQAYLDNVKALDMATTRKDRAAAQAAKAKIDTSCTACHKAHRKQDD